MGAHSLLNKCDRALVAYIRSASIGTDENVLPMKFAGDLPNPPFIGCVSERAVETVKASGNYRVSASIEVHTNAAPDYNTEPSQLPEDSGDLVSDTFDALHDLYDQAGDKLADLITEAAQGVGVEITIQDATITSIEQGRGEKEGEWIDTINLELICYPRT